MIKATILSLSMLAMLPAAALAQENEQPWQQRDSDLVSLAGILGGLHHYQQLCMLPGRATHFRDRMKEMVGLENPHDSLKQRMIDSFNAGYRLATDSHRRCDGGAQQEMRGLASEGNLLTNRLGAPFRQVEGYDYETGTIENGVRVFRGGD